MDKKNDILCTGVVAPFGDSTEFCPFEEYELCTNFNREKEYEKFCKGCREVTPEAMKDFITCEDPFYCYWCEFIRITEIDDLLVRKEKETSSSDEEEYEEEYDDGYDALWELEDAGAFSDEGIMPGCHSRNWEYACEVEDIVQEFRDMAFVGQCIKLAREKAGLSVEVLAHEVEIPESFIEDIENGEYINLYGEKSVDESFPFVMPIPVAKPVENTEYAQAKEERAWWQGCSDERIKEKVADYLCNIFSSSTTQTSEKDAQPKEEDTDDVLPF